MVAIEAEHQKKAVSTLQIIVFRLGNQEYGLPIDQIKEVVITPPITKVPLSASYIKGVANVRGNILAVVDLAQRLGLPHSNDEFGVTNKHNYTLVIESEHIKMGILVKDVPNTLTINDSQIDNAPKLLNDTFADKSYINAIVKLQDRLIILIDIFKIITKDELRTA